MTIIRAFLRDYGWSTVIIIMLAGMMLDVHAQSSSPPAVFDTANVKTIEQALLNTGLTMGGSLKESGLKLMAALATLAVCWIGFRLAISSTAGGGLGEAAVEAFELAIWISIAYALIAAGPTYISGWLVKGFSQIETAYGNMSGSGDVAQKMYQSGQSMMALVTTLFREGSWTDLVLTGIRNAAASLMLAMFAVVGMLACFVGYLTFLLAWYTGVFMVAIAMALAPLLVPFAVLERTRWLFDGWFRFLLSGLMIKLVGVVMAVLFTSALGNHVADQALKLSSMGSAVEHTVALQEIGKTTLLAVFAAFMMFQVKDFAAAIMNGGAGSISTGGRGLGAAASRSISNGGRSAVASGLRSIAAAKTGGLSRALTAAAGAIAPRGSGGSPRPAAPSGGAAASNSSSGTSGQGGGGKGSSQGGGQFRSSNKYGEGNQVQQRAAEAKATSGNGGGGNGGSGRGGNQSNQGGNTGRSQNRDTGGNRNPRKRNQSGGEGSSGLAKGQSTTAAANSNPASGSASGGASRQASSNSPKDGGGGVNSSAGTATPPAANTNPAAGASPVRGATDSGRGSA